VTITVADAAPLAPSQLRIVEAATHRFDADLSSALPQSANRVRQWLGGDIASFALAGLSSGSFPALLLPFWLSTDAEREADIEFHVDLAYSTLNGFCFIRLIDDVADGDRLDDRRRLLPSCAVFHAAFQAAYHRHFPQGHQFWPLFHAALSEQAEATTVDSHSRRIDAVTFRCYSSRKFSAAKIPVAAVLHRYEREHLIASWARCIDCLGRLYQMVNDVTGWQLDLKFGTKTFFLSEYDRTRLAGEPIGAWYKRHGLTWGLAQIASAVAEASAVASEIRCVPLGLFLRHREETLRRQLARCVRLSKFVRDNPPAASPRL
jgi:hypothetical protein